MSGPAGKPIGLHQHQDPQASPGGFCWLAAGPGPWAAGRIQSRMVAMNPEQQQSLVVLGLALLPVALLWWAWLRLLRP